MTNRSAVANHGIGFDMTSLTNRDTTAHLRACIDLAPFPDPRAGINKRSRVDSRLEHADRIEKTADERESEARISDVKEANSVRQIARRAFGS